MKRRTFLKGSLVGSTLILTGGYGSLIQATVTTPDLATQVFKAQSEADVVTALFGNLKPISGNTVKIEAPNQGMLGTGVDVKVLCERDDVSMVAIVTQSNHHPLNTFANLTGAAGYYRTRINIEQTSQVSAYVLAGDTLYSALTKVKMSRSGYGIHAK